MTQKSGLRSPAGALGAAARCALLGLLLIMCATSPAALAPGEQAPPFELKEADGKVLRLDFPTTCPTLLVFISARDRHSLRTVESLQEILGRHDALRLATNRVCVVAGDVAPFPAEEMLSLREGGWRFGLDRQGTVGQGYQLIATPTVYLIETQGRLAAVHAGYDAGLANHLMRSMATLVDPALVQELDAPPTKPNMTLQMARRLADRGLWEKSLSYYERAAAEGQLPAETWLERAIIHARLGDFAKAEEMIASLPPGQVKEATVEESRSKIAELAGQAPTPPTPPRVDR